jgi:hypothetical protein
MVKEAVKKYGKGLGEKYKLQYRGDVDELDNNFDEDKHKEEELPGSSPSKKLKKDND